ncbi:MAG: hypothetical protein AAB373_05865 [Patescibacteria group bacterium]
MKKALMYFVMFLCVLIATEGLIYFIENPEEQIFYWIKSRQDSQSILRSIIILALGWVLPAITLTKETYRWPLIIAGIARVILSHHDVITMTYGSRLYLAASCLTVALWIIETKLGKGKISDMIFKVITVLLFILIYGLL